MSIFRRIFNFEKAKVEQLEKRLNQRYAIGGAFPLHATIRHAGRDYSTRIIDMSSNGEEFDNSYKRGQALTMRMQWRFEALV